LEETEYAQFCMNDIMKGNDRRKNLKQIAIATEYESFATNCHCVNQSCPIGHPLEVVYRDPAIGRKICQGITITICNTTIGAGGNITAGALNIEQQCKGINTQNADNQSSNGGIPTTDASGNAINTSTPISITPPSSSPSTTAEDNSVYNQPWFIPVMVVIGLIVISGIIYSILK
jgi:hypothetical protein